MKALFIWIPISWAIFSTAIKNGHISENYLAGIILAAVFLTCLVGMYLLSELVDSIAKRE